MTERERLHHLIDRLPETEVHTAARFLEYLGHLMPTPLDEFLAAAPEDDEPETEEERQAVAEARADIEAGRVYTSDEVRRQLGL